MNQSSITLNSPARGSGLTAPSREFVLGNPVAEAYARRKWLVELTYAQEHFVVSVNDLYVLDNGLTLDVQTPEDAFDIARRNASKAKRELGDLIAYMVYNDTDEVREQLGVGGPTDEVEHADAWYNLGVEVPVAA